MSSDKVLPEQPQTGHRDSQTPQQSRAGRPKSAEKRDQILKAAGTLFLSNGVSSTSMDMVATEAGVSKQTVYSHFSNKDTLFSAVIEMKCSQYQLDGAHLLDANADPTLVLTEFATKFVSLLRDPEVVAMHRIVISEAQSTPSVAEIFYNAGPVSEICLLCKFLHGHEGFDLDESRERHAAIYFLNMLKGDFHFRELLGLSSDWDAQRMAGHVNRTVNLFVSMLKNGMFND